MGQLVQLGHKAQLGLKGLWVQLGRKASLVLMGHLVQLVPLGLKGL
jgi:hypothetical protein